MRFFFILTILTIILFCNPAFSQPFDFEAAPLAVSTQSETNLIYPWKLIFDGTSVFKYENPTAGVATVSITGASVSDPLKGDTATYADIYATDHLVFGNIATGQIATINQLYVTDWATMGQATVNQTFTILSNTPGALHQWTASGDYTASGAGNVTYSGYNGIDVSSGVYVGLGSASGRLVFTGSTPATVAFTGVTLDMVTNNLINVNSINAGFWELVEHKEVTSAVTSVSFTGLKGDTDDHYMFIWHIIGAVGGTTLYSLTFNNDNGTNYGRRLILDNSGTPSAINETNQTKWTIAQTNNVNEGTIGTMFIHAHTGMSRMAEGRFSANIATETVGTIAFGGFVYNETATEITTITMTADQTNSIGVDSGLSLFREKKK